MTRSKARSPRLNWRTRIWLHWLCRRSANSSGSCRGATKSRRLINATNVAVNRPAAEAGLALLEAGGDFADGVIAYEGNWLGAEAFVSFDRKAVELVEAQGHAARQAAS